MLTEDELGSMQKSILAKIAAIVDDTTLILNVGTEHGVIEGMVFSVVAEQQEIADPDSGESLGNWEVVKARVIVEHVQDRMCTVRSPVKEDIDTPGTLSTMMVQHSFGVYGSESSDSRTSLQVSATDVAGRSKLRPIEVGDFARFVNDKQNRRPTEKKAEAPVAPDLPSKTYVSPAPSTETDDVSSNVADSGSMKESQAGSPD